VNPSKLVHHRTAKEKALPVAVLVTLLQFFSEASLADKAGEATSYSSFSPNPLPHPPLLFSKNHEVSSD